MTAYQILENELGRYEIHSEGCAEITRSLGRECQGNLWKKAVVKGSIVEAAEWIYGPLIEKNALEEERSIEEASIAEVSVWMKPCAWRLFEDS